MIYQKNYFTSENISHPKIDFGFFTRKGGYSKNNFRSLNCSYSSGDNPKIVHKNIELAKKKINLKKSSLKLINQTHSNKIFLINKKNLSKKFEGDGMITQDKNISLAILTADCCPIFIFDNDASFISCIHAGWKGCYLNIIDKAIKKIKNIQPSMNKINVIIGPCLNKINFEVNENFRDKFISKSKNYNKFFYKIPKKNKYLFDMQNLLKFQFIEKNIINIESINLDTYSNQDLFFSHRRSTHSNELLNGRLINIIGFKN